MKNKNENKDVRIEKFIKTTDNWCPNYESDKVRVVIMNVKMKDWEFVRIAVWGADDFGLEMDFQGTLAENDKKFIEWKENIYDKISEPCTEEYFRNLGFYNA